MAARAKKRKAPPARGRKLPATKKAPAKRVDQPSKKKGRAAAKRTSSPIVAPQPPSSQRIEIALEGNTKIRWFTGSLNKQIIDMELTEAELVAKACTLQPGLTPEQLARDGMQFAAKRLIATGMKSEKVSGAGIIGSADERLDKAVALCRAENIEISPSRVGDRAVPPVSLRTAKRYLMLRGLWTPPAPGK